MNDQRDQRPLVNLGLVRAHLIAGLVAFAVLLVAGILFSLQFVRHYPFPDLAFLSPGRVRMVHTNLAAYGFIANSFLGGLLWAVPRLTGQPILSDRLGRFVFIAWQVIVAATVAGQLGGHGQGIEWGETPIFVDPFVLLGLVLAFVNLTTPILRSREKSLYVSLWYFIAAMTWTGLVYFMGNYFPQFWTPGTTGAAISGLFIHDLVGLFVTPIGWGLMYYFVPILLKRPIYSHSLSLVGFWGLAFFYPLQGVHHFLFSPIPMYAQYGAIVATIALEIVVTTVIINFFGTLRGQGAMLRSNLPLRWFFVGMVNYAITCLQCAFQATLTLQQVIHFTDWVVGHAHLVMFGVFGFWITGMVIELWPRLVGRPWYSRRWLEWQFWLSTVGITVMFLDLAAAGLLQGFLWKALAPWSDSVIFSVPFWWVRLASGLMITAGAGLFFANLWLTARAAAPTGAPVDAAGGPVAEPA